MPDTDYTSRALIETPAKAEAAIEALDKIIDDPQVPHELALELIDVLLALRLQKNLIQHLVAVAENEKMFREALERFVREQ